MLFPDEDAPLLKAWIIKRLENTSDADADVLADYVIALLRHEGTVEEVRALCEAEIPDFLKEDTSVFVNDVFNAIQYRSYLPGGGLPRPNPAAVPQPGLPYDDLPNMSLAPPSQNGSRKRSYHDRGDVQMQDAADLYPSQPRSHKQPRRGRGGMMNDVNGFRRGSATGAFPAAGPYRIPPTYGAPTPGGQQHQPPFDPSSFDPNNPLEAMLRLQAMGVPLPPLPPFPQPGQQQQPRRRQRCRDYDTKGYCARGNSCMFEHGTDSIYVPPAMPLPQSPGHEEYDPTNAGIPVPQMPLPNPTQSNMPFNLNPNFQRAPQQHNGKPRFPRKGPRRAAFSAEGPVLDRTKSTIVVENIPEEHFTEDEVRSFFSQYGTIVEVSMRPYKHLAIVKYDSWTAANAAYRSPKVIFDNRFVKVFWYKEQPEEEQPASATKDGGGPPSSAREGSAAPSATPEIDMEDFLRRQEEAQRAFEEKRQKAAEIERQREELERKQKDLLAKQQAERQKLYARIAELSSSAAGKKEPSASSGSGGGGGEEERKKPSGGGSAQSEALRAQLAALEAEAKQLGIDPDAVLEEEEAPWGGFGYRGGGYRGRGRGGGYVPRGRGGYVSRGGYRGRGGGVARGGGHAAYAAYSIDNRPKKVALSGVDFTDDEKSETLRQFLFGIGEFTDIHETPTATTITFKDRKTAEKFFYGLPNKQIPGIEGQVELNWVADQQGGSSSATAGSSPAAAANGGGEKASANANDEQKAQARGNGRDGKDVTMQDQQPEEQEQEMDYDVAGEDQWDIG